RKQSTIALALLPLLFTPRR
nr:Chain B, Alkaline phosphatase peptide [Escherichia coli K-12]